ncbi:MAG: hypothetical protein RI947_1185 [Candidatus Parcubacteria bacterium]
MQSTPPNESRAHLRSRRMIRSMKSQADAKRTVPEKIADTVTSIIGSIWFLNLNILWFFAWLMVNLEFLPFFPPFDPFPFGLLTTAVSLEAIVLSIFVLISQNRAAKIDDLREEIDLQIDIITEQEITKLMQLQVLLLKKNGIDVSDDKELQEMLKPLSTNKVQNVLEKQMK